MLPLDGRQTPVPRQRDGQTTKAPRESNLYFQAFHRYNRDVKPVRRPKKSPPARAPIAISILAGGLSTRMGRDKAKLRLGRRTMLGQVRAVAGELGWPVRVIRQDLVSRCGPLGGIYTALKTSRADAELFLACDMPFVSLTMLSEIAAKLSPTRLAAFAVVDGTAGFPFVIRREALPVVEQQMAQGNFSLQKLAAALNARRVRIPKLRQWEVKNINTPEDWRDVLKVHRAGRSAERTD